MNKSKKLTLHNLLADNKFVLVVSLLIAVVFWATVCISLAPETTVVIEDVPVKIETENSVPSQYNLKMFGEDNHTIDITIHGSKYIVGGKSVTADDFNVIASTSSVTSAGTHSLQLKVSKTSTSEEFTIEGYSASYINVYFDEYAEAQANINVVVSSDAVTEDDYVQDGNYITDKKTVIVGGPAMEISKLSAVVAQVKVDRPLRESTAFDASLVAVDKNNNELKYISFDGEKDVTMSVTIPVYKKVTLPVEIGFTNSPSNYITNPLSYKVSPSNVNVALLQKGTETKTLKVTEIDFSTLKSGVNKVRVNLSDVENIKLLDDSTKFVDIEINVPDVTSDTFNIKTDNISVSNGPVESSIRFNTESIKNVTIYGRESEINGLKADSIKVRADFENVELKEGKNTVVVPMYTRDLYGCWIYGKYKIDVTVEKVS